MNQTRQVNSSSCSSRARSNFRLRIQQQLLRSVVVLFIVTRVVLGVALSVLSGVAYAQAESVDLDINAGQNGDSNREQNLENLRIWHSPESTRLVFDVSASAEYKTFLLQNPLRLVVDLSQVNLSVALPAVQAGNRHLSAIRSGNPVPNVLRVVFDLKTEVTIESFVLTPNELYGHRLVIDLVDKADASTALSQETSKEAAQETPKETLQVQSGAPLADSKNAPDPTANTDKPKLDANADPLTKGRSADLDGSGTAVASKGSESVVTLRDTRSTQPRQFVVAIDAGHGGDDPGAIGHRGTREKKLTLEISKKLHKRINENPHMKAILVRTGDYYIKLKGRRAKARKLGADAFISIHADAFIKKSARGMSVFALSQRGATSAMASTLAAKENASDLLGGVSLADKDEVLAKVLVDLSMTNTISESVNLGGRVLTELGKIGRLHSKRVEQANFSVLRSADVPSILVEAGFITNPEEEKRLKTARYQSKIVNAIYTALTDYLEQTPYASRARYDSPDINRNSAATKSKARSVTKTVYGRHKVVRGDTLSDIAKRYGISLRELKRLNKIKHNTAMLGVRLKVPISKAVSSVPKRSSKSATATTTVIHKVRSGDSLSKISAKYNVTIRAIKRANNLKSNALIKGRKLTIPGVSQKLASQNSNAQPRKHTVRRGDTLSEIAQKYRVTVAKIKSANKMRSNTVRLGQVLLIP